MTETVLDSWFATYTRVPAGFTATPKGPTPTGMVASTVFVVVLMTDTVPFSSPSPQLVTYTCEPDGCTVTPNGLRPTGTLPTTWFVAVSSTATLLVYELVTYANGAAIAETAVQEDVDLIGLSVLSGSHLELTAAVIGELRSRGAGDIPVVIGGVVPARDHAELERIGVRRVFTPSDYKLTEIVGALVELCKR